MEEKLFIDANELYKKSIQLTDQIIESKFKPDAVIGISRGGCFPAISIHEYLNFKGISCDYHVVTAKSYSNNNVRQSEVFIDMSTHTQNCLKDCHHILIIDDVFDSGYTIMHLCNYLYKIGLTSDKYKVATPYYKPNCNKTTIIPHYYIEKTQQWIVFPHELVGLTKEEVQNKSKINNQ